MSKEIEQNSEDSAHVDNWSSQRKNVQGLLLLDPGKDSVNRHETCRNQLSNLVYKNTPPSIRKHVHLEISSDKIKCLKSSQKLNHVLSVR